jgi:hypothetical protein
MNRGRLVGLPVLLLMVVAAACPGPAQSEEAFSRVAAENRLLT